MPERIEETGLGEKPSLFEGTGVGLGAGIGLTLPLNAVIAKLTESALLSSSMGGRKGLDKETMGKLREILKVDPTIDWHVTNFPHYHPPGRYAPDWYVKNIGIPLKQPLLFDRLSPETFRSGYVASHPALNRALIAHELAHASGPLKYSLISNLYKGLGLVGPGIPLVTGYRAAEGEELGKDVRKGALTGGLTGLVTGAPSLLEEARASAKGLGALRKLSPQMISPAEIASGKKALLKAWLTYFLNYAGGGLASGAMMGGIGHTVKARKKWFEEQKKREGQSMKAASYFGFRVGLMHGRAATRF